MQMKEILPGREANQHGAYASTINFHTRMHLC